MLYTFADEGWAPGSPLSASETRAGLYRTRREADEVAAGGRLLAVSVRYDETRGVVTPTPLASLELARGWSAPAIVGPAGGVTTLATIPASLVRSLGPCRLRVHEGHPSPGCPRLLGRTGPARSGFRR
jgi:hypothetical protein